MPVVERNVAILAPRVRDVEVVAHQCEAARNVQRLRGRRWIEEQRMHLARGAVVLEDADVVDAVPRFTPIADPPHGSVLPNTIAASSEPARDNVQLFSQQASCGENYDPRNSTLARISVPMVVISSCPFSDRRGRFARAPITREQSLSSRRTRTDNARLQAPRQPGHCHKRQCAHRKLSEFTGLFPGRGRVTGNLESNPEMPVNSHFE